MKYRLIIADDESKIIQLIRQLGHWEELHIEIIDECKNGEEAYESICINKPDLVLSDIKMPVYGGIELIQKLRDAGVNPFFILLSGYRHFEYARSAIQLNVIDYLLKPIDEGQLNETLKRACACIDEEHRKKEESSLLSTIKKNEEKRKQEDFWKIFLESEEAYAPGGLPEKSLWKRKEFPFGKEACRESFQVDFPHGCYQVLCVFSNLSSLLGHDNSVGNQKIEEFIRESMQKKAVTYYHKTFMGYIILLNYGKEKVQEVRQAVHALYYNILDLSELYGKIYVNIGISRRKEDSAELLEAFKEAHDAEWGRLVYAGNGVLEHEQIDKLPQCRISDMASAETINRIRDAVKYLKIEEMNDLAHEVYRKMGTYNSYAPRPFRYLFFYLEEMIKQECMTDEEKKERFSENYYFAYLNGANYQQVIKNAFLVVLQYMGEEKEKLREKMEKPIAIALGFIRENYQKQISLEETAIAANVSPNYLSKLFKSETGVGFLDYLTQIRLKESERLLSETNLSIKEIAAQVGYLDEKYYSKLFKKTTGIKPSEYRRIYS